MGERPTFLDEPPASDEQERFYAESVASEGFVRNLTRLWCWRSDIFRRFVDLRASVTSESSLTDREVAVLVTATAAAREDSYCALAWGSRLASLSDERTAAGVLAGSDDALSAREQALARWAREVVRDPNGATAEDIERLREAGLSDGEIFDATAFVA